MRKIKLLGLTAVISQSCLVSPAFSARIREDSPQIYNNTMALFNGQYNYIDTLKDFLSSQREVLYMAYYGAAPKHVINKHAIVEAPNNLQDLNFCEFGEYAELAKKVNGQTDLNYKIPLVAAIATCYSGKESIDAWFDINKLTNEEWTPVKKGNEPETGSGTVGFYGLDANPKEGSQHICLKQFNEWGISEKFGIGTTNPGPYYAAAKDQRYNVACGTYYLVSTWLSSQINNRGKCADIVPTRKIDGNHYGTLTDHKFQTCLHSLESTDAKQLADAYNNNKLPELYGPHLVSK